MLFSLTQVGKQNPLEYSFHCCGLEISINRLQQMLSQGLLAGVGVFQDGPRELLLHVFMFQWHINVDVIATMWACSQGREFFTATFSLYLNTFKVY